jgi:hypothetical protein
MRITFSAAICSLRPLKLILAFKTDQDHRIVSSSSMRFAAAVGHQQRVIVARQSTHLRWSMQPPVADRFKANPAVAPRHIPVNSRA